MNHWISFDFLYIFLGLIVVYVILRVYPLVFIKIPNVNETWQTIADEMGLELKTVSKPYPGLRRQPEISGFLHGREVKISSDILGGIWNRYSLINFTISIENPSSQKLPAGAFLVIRKDPHFLGYWYRFIEFFSTKQVEPTILRNKYLIQSIPKNLGNFVFRQQTTEMLLQQPGVFDLHIDRNELSYSLSGFSGQDGLIRQILENLCELAEIFERFVRNWI